MSPCVLRARNSGARSFWRSGGGEGVAEAIGSTVLEILG
jgi:hypothetical protein